jgi:hypothetical protein
MRYDMQRHWRSFLPRLTSKQWHGLMMVGVAITGFTAFLFPGTIFLYAIGSATGVLTLSLLAGDFRGRGRRADGAPQPNVGPPPRDRAATDDDHQQRSVDRGVHVDSREQTLAEPAARVEKEHDLSM